MSRSKQTTLEEDFTPAQIELAKQKWERASKWYRLEGRLELFSPFYKDWNELTDHQKRRAIFATEKANA